jgi:hypothetical protein
MHSIHRNYPIHPIHPMNATLRQRASLIATAILVLLAASPAARGAATPDESRSAFDAAPAASAARSAAASRPSYQLRCWQDGRLVIEEYGIELQSDGSATAPASGLAGSVRLRATDSDRRPLYLTETRNATCLVRQLRADHPYRR